MHSVRLKQRCFDANASNGVAFVLHGDIRCGFKLFYKTHRGAEEWGGRASQKPFDIEIVAVIC